MSKQKDKREVNQVQHFPIPARAEEIQADLQRLKDEEKRLAKVLAADKHPKRRLYIRQCGNASKWYLVEDGVRTYLPKSERPLATKLAQKSWYQARHIEVQTEITACERYLRAFRGKKSQLQMLLSNREFCRLVGTSKPDILAWKEASFQTNPTHPENLIHVTNSGLKVRSKSEVLIATALEKYGLPFRYECLLETPAGPCYPDFTILHPQSGRLFIWEHFGMIDNPSYAATSLPKIGTYAQLGYFPNQNLIMTFETKGHPFNIPEAEEMVHKYFLQ